jgi:beta-phosphoglucomutase-like phosphatase (HAD superfamily)
MSLKLVISDLDGTILETEDYHRRAYNALFGELGLARRWSKEDYSDRLKTMGGEKFREIFEWLDCPAEEYEATKTELYARKTELYVSLIVADLKGNRLALRPGVARLFVEIGEHDIPLAIGSACVKWAALEVLEAALGKEFVGSLAVVCAGDDVERQKPQPDIYLLVAEQCGVRPADCLVLEDTAHGLHAALAAGMSCVVTPSELARGHDFAGAHLVAESMEMPGRLGLEELRALMPG